MNAFVQYFDAHFNLKTKDVSFVLGAGGYVYTLTGVDTSFFPVALYSDGERLTGLTLLSTSNNDVVGFMNDTSSNDTSCIPLSAFYNSHDVVVFRHNKPPVVAVGVGDVNIKSSVPLTVLQHNVDVKTLPNRRKEIYYEVPTFNPVPSTGFSFFSAYPLSTFAQLLHLAIYADGTYKVIGLERLDTKTLSTSLYTSSGIYPLSTLRFVNSYIKITKNPSFNIGSSPYYQVKIYCNTVTNEYSVMGGHAFSTPVFSAFSSLLSSTTNGGFVCQSADGFLTIEFNKNYIV